MYTIGVRLRIARLKNKLSMNKLSILANISNAMISDIENNKVIPGGNLIISLCNVLNISSDWLLLGKEPLTAEEDELKCLNTYRTLTERDKGKVDLFMEQLLSLQLKEEEGKLSS